MDKLTPEQRSRTMSRIKGKNTKPERKIRSLLHQAGYRFRLHRKDLPGTPDLVFPGRKKVLFVHGCFWHGHTCKRGTLPETNREFWHAKIQANARRDKLAVHKLRKLGWTVYTIWECQMRDDATLLMKVSRFLESDNPSGPKSAA